MSKLLGRVLLFLSGVLALWQVGTATIKFLHYNRLKEPISAKIQKWEIKPKGSKFTLTAYYTFVFGGENYEGQTRFSKPYFLNKLTAQVAKKRGEGRKWKTWIDPNNPKDSSLEHRFPFRNIFYAICTLGVFLYFVWLKFQSDMLFKMR